MDEDDSQAYVVQRDEVVAKVMKCNRVLADWSPKWMMDSKLDY